jgi:hypothetical protein
MMIHKNRRAFLISAAVFYEIIAIVAIASTANAYRVPRAVFLCAAANLDGYGALRVRLYRRVSAAVGIRLAAPGIENPIKTDVVRRISR